VRLDEKQKDKQSSAITTALATDPASTNRCDRNAENRCTKKGLFYSLNARAQGRATASEALRLRVPCSAMLGRY